MNVRGSSLILVAVLGMAGLQGARGADQPRALTPAEVKKLVERLGGAEAAVATEIKEKLIGIGPAALVPLRHVVFTSAEQSARKRATAVIDRIAENEQHKLKARLVKIRADKAKTYRIADESLARVFPSYLVFSVRFPMFPVAARPTAPLQARNLFIVDKEGQLEQINDFDSLKKFFFDNTGKVLKGNEAKNPARAWLAMAQELAQDGFYKFSVPDDAIKINQAATGVRVVARALVKPENGNKGYIQIKLDFGLTGDLESQGWEKRITAGRRPK